MRTRTNKLPIITAVIDLGLLGQKELPSPLHWVHYTRKLVHKENGSVLYQGLFRHSPEHHWEVFSEDESLWRFCYSPHQTNTCQIVVCQAKYIEKGK